MKHLYLALIAIVLLAGCDSGQQQSTEVAVAEPAIPYDSLRTVLEKVLETDQGIRQKLMDTNSPEEEKMVIVREMQRIDSANQVIVFDILDQYGWLPQSELGEEAASSLFYVVQHSSLHAMEKYLPQLKQSAQAGEASKVHAAMMEDRLLMWQGKKQIYGTQASNTGSADGSMRIWPIEGPEQVNERRKEAGFPSTVEENAARLGVPYDPKAELPGTN